MDPFSGLPPEVIEKICKDLPVPDLIRTMKASSSVYQACSIELEKRRYEEMQKYLHTRNDFIFQKVTPEGDKSEIFLYFHLNYVTVTQKSSSDKFPWILKEFGPNVPTKEKFQANILYATPELRFRLAKALVDQGYSK